MPLIHFFKKQSQAHPHRQPLNVPAGSNLRLALIGAQVPVASSCGGDAVCAKCGIKIIEGHDHLSPPSSEELKLLEKNNSDSNERLSCLVRIEGDITVDTNYW